MSPRVGCRSQKRGRLGAAREVLGVDHRAAFEFAVVVDDLDVLASLGRQLARQTADPGRRDARPAASNHSGLSPRVAAFMNLAQTGTATSAAKPFGRIVRG